MATNFPLEALKGTPDVLILQTLSRGRLHGYGVSRWIRDTTGKEFQGEEGALYPALRRLEKRGLVESEWGATETGREAKFYTLTPDGRTELVRGVATWRRYVAVMERALSVHVA